MEMSEYVHKSHNVSILLYHYVCPAKYRRVIFDDIVDIEWEHVDKEDLPLIPTKYIPVDEFQVGSSMDEK